MVGRACLIDWSVNQDCTPSAALGAALRCPTDGARGSGGGGEALRPRRRIALDRDRLGGPSHLRLLLARLAQPRQGGLRRAGRAVVGGLRHHLDPLPAGRAAALADDRRAPGERAADRPAAAGRGDDPARPGRRLRLCALALREPLQDELLSGNETLYWILVAAALAFGASFFARGFLAGTGASPSTPCCCSPSPRPGSRLRSRSRSASPAARPRSPWGSSPRPLLSLTVVPLAFAGRAMARSRAEPPPPAPPRRRHRASPSSRSPRAAASPPPCS